jgi:XTP/dITP diphosphohydrolase
MNVPNRSDPEPRILVLATRNPDKVKELGELLSEFRLRVLPASDFPEVPEQIEETEPDLAGNAMLKARTVARACGHWALADDTGLEVDHLGGAPGVETARFAGPGATYEDNVRLLLERLRGIPQEDRGARFRTVVALSDPAGECTCVEGICAGSISTTPQGQGGFGYDPIFRPTDGDGRTFAQMPRAEKGIISHRGRAMQAAKTEIRSRLGVTPDSGAVLVVDDEEIIREITEELLLTQGYRVHTVAGGEEALAFLRAEHEPLRCVLLDQTMPQMDGEECLPQIREIAPKLRVVLCSGRPRAELLPRFRQHGIDTYLQKPFSLEALVRAVEGRDAPGE